MDSHYYQTKSGTLHYVKKPGKGRLIVAIHGVGANHTVWRKVLESVPNPCMIIDVHGHGHSTAEWTDFDTIVADIVKLLKREHVKDYVLAGNSLGASIAIRLSKQTTPTQLIIISPYLRELLKHAWFQLAWLHTWKWIPARLPRRHVDYSLHIGRPTFVYPFLDLRRISTSLWSIAALAAMQVQLSEIPSGIPVSVIIGDHDGFMRTENITAALPTAHVREVACNHILICSKPHEVGRIIIEELL